MKKLVVYSVLCGIKESFSPDIYKDLSGNFDFVLFTDRSDIKSVVWDVRKFDNNGLESEWYAPRTLDI